MVDKLRGSLYIKIFLSFLVTCVLLFVALALFWNHYFADFFYKDKKSTLEVRQREVGQMLKAYGEGSLSLRELRFGLTITSRSFRGQVWIADEKNVVAFSAPQDNEGKRIPASISSQFDGGKTSGYAVERLNPGRKEAYFLIHAAPESVSGKTYVVYCLTPVSDIVELISAVRWNIWVPLLFSLAAVGVILYVVSRKLAGPLRQMNRAALSLADGDFSVRVPVRSRDELGQLAHSFNFMVEQLQQWEDSRQEFLANVSHELRSPLTTLRGLIMGMNDKVIPPERQPHYLQICDQEVQRLQRLVSELLDLARIQNGSDAFLMEPIDAIAKTAEVVDLIAPLIADKGIVLQVWLPEPTGLPTMALLDPDRYAQILHNLLQNAMHFTPSAGRITVHVGTDDDDFRLEVADTGVGMSEDELARVWDRFYKADPSRGIQSEGTGLGLTIVKHLVSAMRGTIEARSRVGEGTAFVVRFPLAAPDG